MRTLGANVKFFADVQIATVQLCLLMALVFGIAPFATADEPEIRGESSAVSLGRFSKCGKTCPTPPPGCSYSHPLYDSNHCITSCGPRTCENPSTATTPGATPINATPTPTPGSGTANGCSVQDHCPTPPPGCSYNHPLYDSNHCVTSCGPRTCNDTTPTPVNPTPAPTPGAPGAAAVLSVLVGMGPNCSTAAPIPQCPDEIAVGGAAVRAVPYNGSGSQVSGTTDALGRAVLTVQQGVYALEIVSGSASFTTTAPVIAAPNRVSAVHVVGDTGIR